MTSIIQTPVQKNVKMLFKILKHARSGTFTRTVRNFSFTRVKEKESFAGVLCDIDGVLLRGRQRIPGARESIKSLYDRNIPVVFLTNQGLQLEKEKAESLSQIFDIQVKPEQVVLSHSPMRLYKDLLDKFVLVLGQQNICGTAKSLGFTNICEIDDIRTAYPLLDMVDKGRRYETLTVSMMVSRKNKKLSGTITAPLQRNANPTN